MMVDLLTTERATSRPVLGYLDLEIQFDWG